MAKCALFVDYENVLKSLKGQGIYVTHKQLAELLKAEAARHGEVVCARAYAPWDIFPEAMAIFDRLDIKPEYVEGGRKDNADLVMSLAIQEFLRLPGRDADTFILVTGDGDFVHVIRLLQQEQKRVVVWGVQGCISARLMNRVAEVVYIQDLLARHGLLAPARPPRAGEAVDRDLAVRALILRAEAVMLARGWVQVPFLTLMHEMSINTLFGEDSEQRRALIVRCLEAGLMETKKQPNPKRPGTETTFVLLKKDHPTVQETLQRVNRIILHLRQTLAGSPVPWVPLGHLDRLLAEDPQLPRTPEERRVWLDLCALEGIVRLERRDPARPNEGVLYLVESHPMVQQVVPGEDLTPLLRRLVLIVDHYLTRTGYAWMSMGLLRQQLAVCGQQEMERSIRVASEQGIIIIRQQPNQFGTRPTTGTYLHYEHPFVQEVLAARDSVLMALSRLFQDRDVVPVAEVVAHLAALGCPGDVDQEWLPCLTSHQILASTLAADGRPAYLLHRHHPVVVKRLAALAR